MSEILFGETEIIDPRSRLGLRKDNLNPADSFKTLEQLGLSSFTTQKLRLNQTASVRGARAEHLGFYINGLEMNDGSTVGGSGDLSVLLGLSGEVSVSLLPQTVRLGESAFAGAIEVNTMTINPRLDLAVNSESTKELGLGFAKDQISGYVQASRTAGISSAQSSTSLVPERDRAYRVSGFSQILAESYRVFVVASEGESDEDGGPFDDDPSAKSKNQNLSTGASWSLKNDIQLGVSGKTLKRNFKDPSDFSGDLSQDFSYKSDSVRFEIQKPYQQRPKDFQYWWLVSAAEQSAEFSQSAFSKSDLDFAAELKWSLTPEFWVESGLRETFSRGAENRSQSRLRLGFDALAFDFSMSERAPSFYQKYSESGNKSLRLERQTTFGTLVQLSDELSFLGYESQFTDLVSFDSQIQKYISFAKTRNTGFDLEWKNEGTSFRASYVRVRDELKGTRLSQFPEWRFESLQKFSLSEFQFLQASIRGVSNTEQSGTLIKASKSIDLKYMQLKDWGDWYISIENLLNETRVFRRGYLESSRVVTIGLAYNL